MIIYIFYTYLNDAEYLKVLEIFLYSFRNE